MKKLYVLILIIIMSVALTACGNDVTENDPGDNLSDFIQTTEPEINDAAEEDNKPKDKVYTWDEFQSAVTLIKNEDYLTSLITLIVFLSVVILLIKIKGFESFLYLGGAYLVSGLTVLIAAVSSSAEKVLEDMLIFLPLGSIFNAPITDFVNGVLYTGFLILFIIGAAFLGGYFTIKYFKKKKEKVL